MVGGDEPREVDVIAARSLRVGSGRVEVAFGRPRLVADDEWACRFRIRGSSSSLVADGHGIDAVQALLDAVTRAGNSLARDEDVHWAGGAGSGLPVSTWDAHLGEVHSVLVHQLRRD
ncbi:DUF6968 family protein [Nocardioides marmoraquaticus]